MKTFEIEVVRTYTTTIGVELPDDNLTPSQIKRIVNGDFRASKIDLTPETYEEDIYDEIWDQIGEKELEQMDTDLLEIKVKELTQ
jgi:hypothetical protein